MQFDKTRQTNTGRGFATSSLRQSVFMFTKSSNARHPVETRVTLSCDAKVLCRGWSAARVTHPP